MRTTKSLEELNKEYKALTPKQRVEKLYKDFDDVLFTSSFGATSAYMLHLVSSVNPDQPVHFIDTGFHFQETIEFKNKVARQLNLHVIDLKPDAGDHEVTQQNQTWKSNPDLCCSINKINPLEQIKSGYEVWISGLMGFQSKHREQLNIFEEKDGIIKFYPAIDVTEEALNNYLEEHNLPVNPLKHFGFESVGCKHCTWPGKYRNGRWVEHAKTECGLHV